jgi:hypothetical protein
VDTAKIVAIQQLYALYGHVMDDRTWDRLGEIFTPEIVFDATSLGVPLMQGFGDIIHTSENSPQQPLAHHVTNVLVESIDGGEAKVRAKAIGMFSKGRAFSGDYEDTLVMTDAGWRIKHRINSTAEQRAKKWLKPAEEQQG